MNDSNYVKIFDTTLRDGQQCPGAGMSFEENIDYALLAHSLGVDILEAGFPSASSTDFEIVRAIAAELSPQDGAPLVTGLCQLREEQVDRTIESLEPAIPHRKARLHSYVPVDPRLMPASLGELAEKKSEIVQMVHDYCRKAVEAGLDVQFSPEGYSRQGENFDFVSDCIRAAVQAGAKTINCPDTIGAASHFQGSEYFVELMNRHAQIIREEFPENEVTWSVHCHNDFGLAVINSINGVFRGPARQIEGCINGIGERAGNASLEQCIMILRHFRSDTGEQFETGVRAEFLKKISDFVSEHMLPRQPHWPVSGRNAARHSSGGHTNAILKDLHVYQPFNPVECGQEVSLLFGPLSGGNHAKSIIEDAGYLCEDAEKTKIAQFIKDLYADRRKGITEEELMRGYFRYRMPMRIDSFDYSRSKNQSAVHLEGVFFGQSGEISSTHEGRDSALAALKNAIDEHFPGFNIASHQSKSVGDGIQAKSLSTIILKNEEGLEFEGTGKDRDIEISAMKALIDAVNTAYIDLNFKKELQG